MSTNKQAEQKIIELLSYLGITQDQVSFRHEADLFHIDVAVPVEEAGIYIGRFASVLDSLQLIISLMLKNGEEHQHVLLDIGGYRVRRLEVLQDMANRLAAEAEETGTPRAFPPLSSTERRQIHLMFVSHATLTTFSQGEGFDRRLFVAPRGH